MIDSPGVWGRFGKNFVLARVDSLDYQSDESGNQVLDENQNPIPTGLINITFLEKGGGRNKVPFVMPAAGNSQFMGGLPELGSLCVCAFGQTNDPLIIGFLPPSIHGLVGARQTLPNLVPGELYAQASIPDYDINAQANFFTGANIWLDRYGRLKITGLDYEFVMGYLLSNEFTDAVTQLVDPVTQSPIYFREKIKGTERRVDDLGNAFFSYPKDTYSEVGGDNTKTISGEETKTFKRGFTWQDGKGNSIVLQDTGALVITLNGGSLQITSQGNVLHESGAAHTEVVGSDWSSTVGGNALQVVAGQRTSQIGGVVGEEGDLKTVSFGDDEEHILTGKKLIRALTGVTLEATGGPVNLGSDLAFHPVPHGDILATYLGDIVTLLGTIAAAIPLGGPGAVTAVTTFVSTVLPGLTATLNSLNVNTD